MQSLRTRKPSQARSKEQQRSEGTNKLSKPGGRDGRKSTRVDDKIKKRMSMRYADISSPTGVSVPAVPSLPIGVRLGPYRPQDDVIHENEEPTEDPRAADLRMLDKGEFDSDAFLKKKLANSTEAELKSLQSSLQGLKDGVALDLQRNVFKNYAEFVVVSKEVSTLENEMLEFKDSLAEWKGMPSLLHIDDSASVAERRRNVRSSIADLKVLYANQMQTLHTQIEGSSKFVPTTPGRHVIIEMDGIFSLNPATYKVDHSVRFVLLDDAVLVAKRRRRRNNTESEKLIAERCWPLSEMLVLDTKDTASMTNVLKIRHNKETHVYRTEFAADKKTLLSQFRHVAEELAAKKRKEREGEHQRRKSFWVGGDRNSIAMQNDIPPMPDFLSDLIGKSPDMGSSAKEKTERDARWVGDFSDELTVAIALRQWDRAVTLVEEGEEKLPTIPSLSTKLTTLKTSLISSLLQSLSMPTNRKLVVVHLVSLLVRLKAGAAARNTLLNARTEVMKKNVRMITFEGHIGSYIGDLSVVVFTGIKNTADWFLTSFKENEVASCFVEWAKEQIEHFAEMFRKQVYGPDVAMETVEDVINITQSQSKKLLEDFGLDFRYLLLDILSPNPKGVGNGGESSPLLSRPPPFRPHTQIKPEPIYTPASTPTNIRSRSPAPGQSQAPPAPIIISPIPARARARSPAPIPSSIPSSLNYSPTSQLSPVFSSSSSSPSRMRSPAPRAPSSASINSYRSNTPSASSVHSTRPATPIASESQSGSGSVRGLPRPPLPIPRGSPAPPPRSRDRPGSAAGHRPPPVAIPRREGMF